MPAATAHSWTQLLDSYEMALTGAQAALDNGEWPADGWTAPSLAVPVDEPTDGELDRYRQLSATAQDVEGRLIAAMDAIRAELGQGRRSRDAARAYGHASAIEQRARV